MICDSHTTKSCVLCQLMGLVVRNSTSRRGDYRTKVSEERSEVTEEAEDLIVNFENRRLIWNEKFCS